MHVHTHTRAHTHAHTNTHARAHQREKRRGHTRTRRGVRSRNEGRAAGFCSHAAAMRSASMGGQLGGMPGRRPFCTTPTAACSGVMSLYGTCACMGQGSARMHNCVGVDGVCFPVRPHAVTHGLAVSVYLAVVMHLPCCLQPLPVCR